jgi:hypothetical protein
VGDLFAEVAPPPADPPRQRLARLALAALVTASLLGLALLLGDWAYGQRRLSMHEGRLQRALDQQPTLAALAAGLGAEPGVVELDAADPAAALARLTEGRAAGPRDALLARAREAAALRLFRVEADLLYVAFGDAAGRFSGFAIVEVEIERSPGGGDQKR